MVKELENQNTNRIALFEGDEIRRILVDDEWYFSVVDVIAALTDSSNPRNYWSTLKKRSLENGVELSTNCVQLKMLSADGKNIRRIAQIQKGCFALFSLSHLKRPSHLNSG